MKIEKQSVVNKMVDLFKVDDKKMAQSILSLMLEPTDSLQRQFKGLLSKPRFNVLLKNLLNQDLLGRDIEWVLVIPLWRYLKNSNNQYELIFGIGQEISKKDLFLIWDSGKKKIILLNLRHDERRRDIMSLHEAQNLATQYGIDVPKVHPHHKSLRYATIENIKEYLKLMLKDKSLNIDISKSCIREDFLFKPQHLKTELRYLNVILNILKNASLILLKDVFDTRYSFHKKNKESSFDYDAYSVLRKFLKYIGIYPNRQGGLTEKRERVTAYDSEEIVNMLMEGCLKSEVKESTSKQIKEAFEEQKYPAPKEWLIRRIKNQIKSGISALKISKNYHI